MRTRFVSVMNNNVLFFKLFQITQKHILCNLSEMQGQWRATPITEV